nr:hypothetical protein CFP56_45801 [Quercus suber]
MSLLLLLSFSSLYNLRRILLYMSLGSTTSGSATSGKTTAARSMEEWRLLSRALASEWVDVLNGGGQV